MAQIDVTKLRLLFALLPRSAPEFWDRLVALVDVQWDRMRPKAPFYKEISFHDALDQYGATLKHEIASILSEKPLMEIEDEILGRIPEVKRGGPFRITHNADITLARFCYVVTRTTAPDVVVETGVAYGVTSSFVLQALAVNGRGELWSIDLPPLACDADKSVGLLIPGRLRGSWHLSRGTAARRLPNVLQSVGKVDFFIHDSLHTYRNITRECDMVWPVLSPGGVLVADDIEDNRAFGDFATRVSTPLSGFVREESKNSLFGFILKGAAKDGMNGKIQDPRS